MAALVPTKKIPELTNYGADLNGNEEFELWVVNTSRRVVARKFILPALDSIITVTPLGVPNSMARQLASSPTVQVVDGGPGGQVTLNAVSAIGAPTELQTLVTVAGNNNNVAIANDQIGFIDINTAAGAADITGIIPRYDGEILTLTNIGANLARLMALSGLSGAANQIRLPVNVGLVQNMSYTIRYSLAIGKWVPYS